ncbi:MAG: hypothetical protein AUH33_02195 [Chloroflexi bacterium 13_1_40CM_68_21]|nr:MAG: hypothetical protein AUH33_02195 [Chloroflexi bacterium 13_1_40CM_68_21]
MRRWWDDGVRTPYPDAVLERYRAAMRGELPTYRYMAYVEGAHAGMFQHYRIADWPEYEGALALNEDAIGADLFIGEPELIGHGHGPEMLRMFLGVAFPFYWKLGIAIKTCVIGPSVNNTSAIRACEKAGFRFVRAVSVPGEPDLEHLMRLTSDQLGPFAG